MSSKKEIFYRQLIKVDVTFPLCMLKIETGESGVLIGGKCQLSVDHLNIHGLLRGTA